MKPRLQKFVLLAHITFSVGWVGAVLPYLALAIAAFISHDEQMVRGACRSMEVIGWFVIVPFSLGALSSGLIQSLGTRWGLFRHWWIVAKLLLTLFAVVVLLQHMRDVSRLSRMAMMSRADLRPELIHSFGGLLVLIAVMALSIFKPWGTTPYGRSRASQPLRASSQTNDVRPMAPEPAIAVLKPRWQRIVGYHAVGLLALFAILHLFFLHVAGLHPH